MKHIAKKIYNYKIPVGLTCNVPSLNYFFFAFIGPVVEIFRGGRFKVDDISRLEVKHQTQTNPFSAVFSRFLF